MHRRLLNQRSTPKAARRRRSTPPPSPGLSYLEFLIVAPVVLTIVFGMVEVGRLMSQYIWFSRAATQVVTMASITPQETRQATLERFADDLYGAAGSSLDNFKRDAGFDPSTGKVWAELKADLRPMVKSYSFSLRTRAEMDVLLTREYSLGNLSWSDNPPQFYNCNGQPLRVGNAPCTQVACARTSCP